jgi:NAD+ diphosphatase
VTSGPIFTGAQLDRAGDARRRDPEWAAAQRNDPNARALIAGTGGIWIDGSRLHKAPLAEVSGPEEPLLLGIDDEGPLFVIDEDVPPPGGDTPPALVSSGAIGGGAEADQPTEGPRAMPLFAAVTVLPHEEAGLGAYVTALLNWHRRHRFCSSCGVETGVGELGLVRLCPRCGVEHHPRTDPVVIMLVTDGDDRLLLGRQPSWPAKRYSAMAGFVEPGEALEAAVIREIGEEAGVVVADPTFVGSQPWPFPCSLMLGFEATYVSGEATPQADEMDAVTWFTREQVIEAADLGLERRWDQELPDPPPDLILPPPMAIARWLIQEWLDRGGPLR